MKNILTIMKKELSRVFKDKFLIIALLLPGIMIFVMYNFLGDAFAELEGGDGQRVSVATVGMPSEVKEIFDIEDLNLNADYIDLSNSGNLASAIEENAEKVKNGELGLLIVFGENFLTDIQAGQKPNIEIYFNPTDSSSASAYEKVNSALSIFRLAVLADRQIDADVFHQNVNAVYNEKSAIASAFSMMLPMLMITMLFSSCMSLAPDAIAGEKERGTIATILVTPIKRSHLAFGKVFALSILATISAASTFLGLILSLPKLMGGVELGGIYGFSEFLLLFLVLFSTVLLIIGIMSVLSALAKSVKEATMFIVPIMLASIVVSILSMTSGGASASFLTYLIPIFNSAQSMTSILTFDVNVLNLVVTFVSNLVYMAVCVFVMAKLFNNEKVMFKK